MDIIVNSRQGVIVELDPCQPTDLCVAKILPAGVRLNKALHKKVHALDPNGERFARYELMAIEAVLNKTQRRRVAKASGVDLNPVVLLSPAYEELNPKKLNKCQYRHLRDSIDLLASNNIAHGDLVGNVMLNPDTNLPVIIDFGEGRLDADATALKIDRNSFLMNFKKGK